MRILPQWLIVAGMLPFFAASAASRSSPAVGISQDSKTFTLTNGLISAEIEKSSGVLMSLKYHDNELLGQGRGGAEGGYWSSVGRGRPGSSHKAIIRLDPEKNNGERAEISCLLQNGGDSAAAPVDADYRYSLGRGEHWLYVYCVLEHKPGYPAFGVGEARYCMKLNPTIFDYLTVDAERRRVMPSGYDWDHGEPLNLKEARRMTTGVHKGEPEHKYDYSALLYDTPIYGWSSTQQRLGLWLINPSLEYMGGGPTKAELTGHLDVNPGGLPTLLNMWVGSHYGGTSLAVATNEAWTKVVGPFLIYCNATTADAPSADKMHYRLWQDALSEALREANAWPYSWVNDPNYPLAKSRGRVAGRFTIKDTYSPDLKVTNMWVGLSAADYEPPRIGFGLGRRNFTNFFRFGGTNSGFGTNNPPRFGGNTNFSPGGFARFGGFPPYVDWQRDAKFYQFWARADSNGQFEIRNIRPGNYTLHAIAEGVLGEFSITNTTVKAAEHKQMGELTWLPMHYGRPLWQIGIPDRTAREFRHGDHYWQWGLYFDYSKEFPKDVNFVIGKSDPRTDWNYVQPPRTTTRDVGMVSEDDEHGEGPEKSGGVRGRATSSTWSITFFLPESVQGKATLRLAFCGTHQGCDIEVLANGKSVGSTGPLPSTSAMQRDGIRAYWLENAIAFDGSLLQAGTNMISLLSHANSWSQGVMYDCVRLEVDDGGKK
ncbi:MAG TPA: polysaccharide lyase family protein [Candidatus Dormibacteraeota bacterium]|nr:polysaccharide lyase family protein [Candidatus Dormibacteraeota bacterium]